MKQFSIKQNDANQRLDKFLQKAAPNLPPAMLYKSLRTKHIKVNKKRSEGNYILQIGDIVDCWLKDEFFTQPEYAYDFLCAEQVLEVLYEDEHILLADKPAGLLSHPNEDEYVDTLLGRVQRYLYENQQYNPDAENTFAPALVNRIDRNTQGIVIAAKTAQALREMNEKMKQRQLCKFYLCAVWDSHAQLNVCNTQWIHLQSWMRKDEKKSQVMVYDSPRTGAKECLTNYRVLHRAGDIALLEVELLTGRTHQIRAQFAHLGHALVGDGKYATRAQYNNSALKWQCLCSWRLICGKLDISVNQITFLRELFPGFALKRENI